MNHFKKNQNKSEKLRGIFFQIGLIIAGGLTLLAFEWKSSYVIEIPDPKEPPIDIIDDLPPLTFQEAPEKPKVKFIQPTDIIDLIDIIVDDISPDDAPNPNDDLPEFIPTDTEPVAVIIEDPTPFRIVEKMPEFVGGEKARLKFLGENIKYPRFDKEAGIEGTVHLQFVINKKGEIKNIEILRGVSELMDKEAIRVLKAMPKWSPGKQRGKPVKVILTMPIKFELR